MMAVACLDFLPWYFSLATEVSIGHGINELRWALPYVFRQLLTGAPHKIKRQINGGLLCSRALMKHFD